MPNCTTNITMPVGGEPTTVTLAVDFEVEPADPSVGIMGDSIAAFTARVIEIDNETPELLAAVQAEFDATTYRDVIEEACIDSLSDDRGGD